MKPGIFLLILSLLCITIIACKNQQSVTGSTRKIKISPVDSPLVTMTRGGCYGKCPVYTLRVYSNGKATFEGKRFVTKAGFYEKSLGDSMVNVLVNDLEQADVWNMKDNYPTMASDLPDVKFFFQHNGKNKTIDGFYQAPKSLQDIAKTLFSIGDSNAGWQKTGDLPEQK